MCLCEQEGHSYALDMATASLGLISQQAAAGLVCATVPHAASYSYLSWGKPRNYLHFRCLFPKFSSEKKNGGGMGGGVRGGRDRAGDKNKKLFF